ncbi:Tic20 family protein [Synechocystis sp. PCC 7509]|uniref:Tic20 family protein n=1 Tax=Synechocystis sp. PCC 7509 TaxID=927677 RepID=UPI0002AC0D85|nr:Tic20 family protein [Synechocystis sp. PCC 7509]
MSLRGSTTIKERIFACLPYLLPLIEGIIFGRFLFAQVPELELFFVPIAPLIILYEKFPIISLVVFFALFLLVVRNESIAHFIRFNTMQAILIDIVLFLCSFGLKIFGNSFAAEILSNTVFIGLVAAVGYSVIQSALGRYAEVPVISEAVYMQVR